MSWKTFHNRGETLRVVIDTANSRRDGVLPMDVPGVAEHFIDELDLVGALLLKWHARLSGNIERALVREPMDLESAVASAWHTTAEQMPGVRLVIDGCAGRPAGPEMARAMFRAREKEWARLAVAAGLANTQDEPAAAAGRRLEERARLGLPGPAARPEPVVQTSIEVPSETPNETPTGTPNTTPSTTPASTPCLADRIRAVLAA